MARASAMRGPAFHECVLGAKYAGVSLVGFASDAILLHLMMAIGLEPALARFISLATAMQVTFVLNGLHVFRTLRLSCLPRQWASYMVSNGVGNFSSYWIFVTLVSAHWPVVSAPMVALSAGAFSAWTINYACTRFVVFRKPKPDAGP
jgi:putative flippase GtrA